MRSTVTRSIAAVFLVAGAASFARAQTGTFMGVVTRDTLGNPVQHAEVRLTTLNRSVETNALGEFRFNDVPAGHHSVAVRAIGFQAFTAMVDILAGQPLDAELTLSPLVTRLDTLLTTAKARATVAERMRDFEDRRQAHIAGSFISDSALRANPDAHLSSLIAMLPGVRSVLDNKSSAVFIATGVNLGDGRPVFQANNRPCYMTVWVDGVKIYENNSNLDQIPNFADLRTSDYAGIEIYTSSSMVPAQFSATGSSCGVILLWTREPRLREG